MTLDPYALEAENVRQKLAHEALQQMLAVRYYDGAAERALDDRVQDALAAQRQQQQR